MATVTAAVPACSSRTMGPLAGIAAHVGAPLATPDLRVCGWLCGVAFRARPRSAARDLPWVEVVARMLSSLLGSLLAAGMTPHPVDVRTQARLGDLASPAD